MRGVILTVALLSTMTNCIIYFVLFSNKITENISFVGGVEEAHASYRVKSAAINVNLADGISM